MRSKRLVVPVTKKEHDEVPGQAKKRGFDSVAAYIRSLIRKDMEGKKDG